MKTVCYTVTERKTMVKQMENVILFGDSAVSATTFVVCTSRSLSFHDDL